MKHTLLIALLGATVTLATPSLSFADNGYRANGGTDGEYRQKHQKAHANKNRRQHKNDRKKFVAKPPKPHRIVKQIKRDHNKIRNNTKNNNKNRHHNRQVNKHGHGNKNKHAYNNRGHNNHNFRNKHRNKPEFSISWNVGDSTISYGNDGYNNGYNNTYNNGYNTGHRKNRGKKIYKRIHRQANRIQRGINNGQLVKREVRKLRRQQRHIKQSMAHYKRDGHLNRHERSKLNQLLDVASNNIHRKSNNQWTRYSRHNNHYAQY